MLKQSKKPLIRPKKVHKLSNGKKRLSTNKKAKLPPKTDKVFFILQDCTNFVKFGLTLAIPVTVARHDPAKKGKM